MAHLCEQTGYQRTAGRGLRPSQSTIAIGERRASTRNNLPGYLSVDGVGHGDQDGVKDRNHINAAEFVTQ